MRRQDKRELVSIRIVVCWTNCMLFTQHFKHSWLKAKLAKSFEFKTLNVNMYGSLSNILWIFTSNLLRTGWRTSLIPLLYFVPEKTLQESGTNQMDTGNPQLKLGQSIIKHVTNTFLVADPTTWTCLVATARRFFASNLPFGAPNMAQWANNRSKPWS